MLEASRETHHSCELWKKEKSIQVCCLMCDGSTNQSSAFFHFPAVRRHFSLYSESATLAKTKAQKNPLVMYGDEKNAGKKHLIVCQISKKGRGIYPISFSPRLFILIIKTI